MMKGFPTYLQRDMNDCGPTCIQMIAKFYGRSFAIDEIRRRSAMNRRGSSLLGISDAAESFGFRTLGLKISFIKLLNEAPLPCIVHWKQNHFVIVYEITKNRIKVADPSIGIISYTKSEFLKCWMLTNPNLLNVGIVLLITPTPLFYSIKTNEESNQKVGLKYILKYVSNYHRFFRQIILGILLGSIIQFTVPFLTQSIVDVSPSSSYPGKQDRL